MVSVSPRGKSSDIICVGATVDDNVVLVSSSSSTMVCKVVRITGGGVVVIWLHSDFLVSGDKQSPSSQPIDSSAQLAHALPSKYDCSFLRSASRYWQKIRIPFSSVFSPSKILSQTETPQPISRVGAKMMFR